MSRCNGIVVAQFPPRFAGAPCFPSPASGRAGWGAFLPARWRLRTPPDLAFARPPSPKPGRDECYAGSRRARRSAAAASSGVLTLKNGSSGVAGHSAMAIPWRAVHTSILCRPLVDQGVAQVVAQRERPQADHRVAPVAGARAGKRRAGRSTCRVKPRHHVARQERAVARHARRSTRSPAHAPPPSRARRGCRRAARRNPARCRRRPAGRSARSEQGRRWH